MQRSMLFVMAGTLAFMASGSCRKAAPPLLVYAYEAPIGCGFDVHGTRGDAAYVVGMSDFEVLIPGGDDLTNSPSSLAPGVDGIASLSTGDVVIRCTLIGRDGTRFSQSYWILNHSACTLTRCDNSQSTCAGVDINSLTFVDPWNLPSVVVLPDP